MIKDRKHRKGSKVFMTIWPLWLLHRLFKAWNSKCWATVVKLMIETTPLSTTRIISIRMKSLLITLPWTHTRRMPLESLLQRWYSWIDPTLRDGRYSSTGLRMFHNKWRGCLKSRGKRETWPQLNVWQLLEDSVFPASLHHSLETSLYSKLTN